MARLENRVMMSGYIATDPAVMGKDRNAARFRIRHDRSKKTGTKPDGSPEWGKDSSFFSVIMFGAENAEKISGFKKSEKVIVIGSLRQNQTPDKEYIDIVADEIALTDPNGREFKPDPSNDVDWLDV